MSSDDRQSSEPGETGAGHSSFDATSTMGVLSTYIHPGKENVMLIYVLYLVGLIPAFGVVPILVGFIMALLNRQNATGPWASHYEYQFRQAIAGLIAAVVSGILVIVVVGLIGLLLVAIWWIVRSVKGLQAASHEQPIPNPASYSW
jgi:uncharacterized membrane protein